MMLLAGMTACPISMLHSALPSEDLDRRLDAKRLLAHRYVEAFSDLDGVDLVLEPPAAAATIGFGPALYFRGYSCSTIDAASTTEAAHAVGLLLSNLDTLHHLPMYESCPAGPLPVAAGQAPRLVNVPSSPQLLDRW